LSGVAGAGGGIAPAAVESFWGGQGMMDNKLVKFETGVSGALIGTLAFSRHIHSCSTAKHDQMCSEGFVLSLWLRGQHFEQA
jgi:hypothetical protein